MRIEKDFRAMHFNVYTDTDSEYKGMVSIMEDPLPSPTQITKLMLNSIYGKAVTKMNREYISVIVDSKPVVIFKDKIVAVEKGASNKAYIYTCTDSIEFHTSNNYADVIKQLV